MADSKDSLATNARPITTGAQPPRIVFLHYSAPPVVGGVEAVIAEHARLFAAAGFPTRMIAGRNMEGPDAHANDMIIVPEMDSENERYLKLRDDLAAGIIPPDFAALKERIGSALAEQLRDTDIVFAHNVLTMHFNLALTAALHELARRGRIPRLIVWCHDISRHVNPARSEPQYDGEPWDLLRTRIEAARYVAVSSERQNALAGILGCPAETIEVIPNGVDPKQLLGLSDLGVELAESFGLLAADLVLLMPVRITRAKNIEFAMQVAAALKAAGCRLRLVISGPPDPHVTDSQTYLASLVALKRQLGLTDEVVFVHEGTAAHPAPLVLEAGEVGELYRLADVVLMPSLREGFGLPVLEAGLAGKPVFVTAIPVTNDLPGFQYLIGAEESAESVAGRILAWAKADNTHRLRRIVRSEFTWSRIFRSKLLPLTETVMASGAGGPR